ncbi:hypothetical protein [Streptomyces sp. NPDC048516]|uniref:hypothetical protein n=1 Tax=Streptomyces sp. NPDC048516 TaxID=3365565 RepID=UPI00371B7A53
MNGPGPEGAASGRPVEDRLRGAFAARAESISLRDLRPAAPPGPHTRRGRLPGPMRPWLRRLRRFGLPLAAAAATAAVVIGFLATSPGSSDRPLPATPPSPVGPTPSPSRTGPSPAPSPNRSSPAPPRTAGPSRSGTPGGIPARPPRPSRSDTPTPRPTEEPGGDPSGTAVGPSTPPSVTPTPRGNTHVVPGKGGTSSSPPPS